MGAIVRTHPSLDDATPQQPEHRTARLTFAPPDAFTTAHAHVDAVTSPDQAPPYRLLPFRFMRLDGPSGQVLVANDAGEHVLLAHDTFASFVARRLARPAPGASRVLMRGAVVGPGVESDDDAYNALKARHFLTDSDSTTPLRLLSTKIRTKRSFLADFTKLHIFVVTLRCDHSCHYCQVSRVSVDRSRYDMSRESAARALELVFRSPARALKIEFQGGEPLLNFDVIQFVVEEAERRAASEGRRVEFVVTTNLSFLSDEILAYLREHRVGVSTSLDGPAFLHNANRPRPGNDAYESTVAGIARARAALGHHAVSALMTTTRLSLDHPVAIVDEFVAQGFDHIFLRPLSPYGFAIRTQHKTGYDLDAFLTFYRRALGHIIERNRAGEFMVEVYARLLLTRILTPFATGYVDLQSPAGAGISVAVYNYDGDVYATDESRMLAQMGDDAFRLGNVHSDTYESIFGGPRLRALVAASCVESLPGCAECALNTFCGADPVEHYATQGDAVGHRPTSRFCGRNTGVITHLLRLYYGSDPFVRRLFWSWVQNVPMDELLPTVPEDGTGGEAVTVGEAYDGLATTTQATPPVAPAAVPPAGLVYAPLVIG